MGHSLTLLAAAAVLIGLKVTMPDILVMSLEFTVAVMIVVLGASTLIRVRKERLHLHGHSHEGRVHNHVHSHEITSSHTHHHKPFVIGALHGLAGTAGISLLLFSNAASLSEGLLFLLLFGLGSLLGMIALSTMISLPLVILRSRIRSFYQVIRVSGGLSSAVFGVWLAFAIIVQIL